ncbi:MAG: hypothetical protein H0V93_14380 [Euzebyales bacterium]|nr:hypothetical protein [Euzebyales bacterium]
MMRWIGLLGAVVALATVGALAVLEPASSATATADDPSDEPSAEASESAEDRDGGLLERLREGFRRFRDASPEEREQLAEEFRAAREERAAELQARRDAFVADVAEELGVPPAELESAVTTVLERHIDEAVEAGDLDPDHAEDLKARIEAGDLFTGLGGHGLHKGFGEHRGSGGRWFGGSWDGDEPGADVPAEGDRDE